jgi:hypothetical protein
VFSSDRHPGLLAGVRILRVELIAATKRRVVVLQPGKRIIGPVALTGEGTYVRFRCGGHQYIAHIDDFVHAAGLAAEDGRT